MKTLKRPKKVLKRNSSNYIIMGLGNPGSPYEGTRHNVGFQLIELLQEQLDLSMGKPFFQPCMVGHSSEGIVLVKPLTFMNRSGQIIPWLQRKFKLENHKLIVVVDNMDLPPGKVRMKAKGSSAGHNGLKSLIHHLGTGEFYRLYVGIGRPEDQSVVDHVLGVPGEEHSLAIKEELTQIIPLLLQLNQKELPQIQREINGR